MKRVHSLIALAIAMAGLFGASASQAVTIYSLGLGNPPVAAYVGPYAEVAVTLVDADTANVVFTSLSNGSQTFLLGNGGSVAVNVNATSWILSNITLFNAGIGFSAPSVTGNGPGVEDGFGSFNETIDLFDGYTRSVSSFSFQLDNTSGTWASDADVLTPNASGYQAAAHIFVATCATAASCDASNPALDTGFATVPEPGTALLLSFGLIALGIRRR